MSDQQKSNSTCSKNGNVNTLSRPAPNIYGKFGDILWQYNRTKEAWLDNYKAKAQVQAAADALGIKIDIEKLTESESALMTVLKHGIAKELPHKIIEEILEAIVRHAHDHAKAVKEVAKQGSDDAVQAAVYGAANHADDTAHAIKDGISHIVASSADDVARGIIGSFGDEAAQTAAQTGLAALGPFATIFGAMYDHSVLNDHQKHNNNALMYCNRPDLKIALDYAKQKNAGKNPGFDSKHERAVRNLAEAMERNGGVKLFTQKIIRDIGTVGGFFGGPGGGLAVLGAMKYIESEDRIPTDSELGDHWTNIKLTTASGIGLGFFVPPLLLLTIPAKIAADAAMAKLCFDVEKWNYKTSDKKGMPQFLQEIGEKALEMEKFAPKDFQDENLRMRQLTLAEGAVARIARGYKHHSVNDIIIASQFAQSADGWFPKKDDEKPIDKYMRESATNLAERIKQTGITDSTNKNQVLKYARQGEKEGLSR